jgi:hypothetical protein
MLARVPHLVEIEEVEGEAPVRNRPSKSTREDAS